MSSDPKQLSDEEIERELIRLDLLVKQQRSSVEKLQIELDEAVQQISLTLRERDFVRDEKHLRDHA